MKKKLKISIASFNDNEINEYHYLLTKEKFLEMSIGEYIERKLISIVHSEYFKLTKITDHELKLIIVVIEKGEIKRIVNYYKINNDNFDLYDGEIN